MRSKYPDQFQKAHRKPQFVDPGTVELGAPTIGPKPESGMEAQERTSPTGVEENE